ncbi:hypothetical protein [Flavobacterium frigidarium]|nr:hypothetical protein [Flavobacterium frigidarium]
MDNTFSVTLLIIGIVQFIIGLIEYVFPPLAQSSFYLISWDFLLP